MEGLFTMTYLHFERQDPMTGHSSWWKDFCTTCEICKQEHIWYSYVYIVLVYNIHIIIYIYILYILYKCYISIPQLRNWQILHTSCFFVTICQHRTSPLRQGVIQDSTPDAPSHEMHPSGRSKLDQKKSERNWRRYLNFRSFLNLDLQFFVDFF